jgi:hypothetical protein
MIADEYLYEAQSERVQHVSRFAICEAAEPVGCYSFCGDALEETVDFAETTGVVGIEVTCCDEDNVFD